MQSERVRQLRRERKRLGRERAKKSIRKAQMCAGDELESLLPGRVASLFKTAERAARQRVDRLISAGDRSV
jgi:hypothetical protein